MHHWCNFKHPPHQPGHPVNIITEREQLIRQCAIVSVILPYGNINFGLYMLSPKPSANVIIQNTVMLGKLIREKRKASQLTQARFAMLCGVGTRFISDLENGKPTIEFGKTLTVLKNLGLLLQIIPRGWHTVK